MANQTMLRFGYPDSLVKEYENWVVLLRPAQVTAGCVILACTEEATSLGDISPAAGEELPVVCQQLESALRSAYQAEKFNYLALMMVDPNVHFHVIPRYSSARVVEGTTIEDGGWPKVPALGAVADLSETQMTAILDTLRSHWSA